MRRFVTISVWIGIDLAAFTISRALGTSEVVAGFLVLLVNVNVLRYAVEEARRRC